MDFVEALPKSGAYVTVLVVVHQLTKYAHYLGLKHPFTTKSVGALFVRKIVRLHGFLSSIVSYRDKIFTSIFWSELLLSQGIALLRSTTYHLKP